MKYKRVNHVVLVGTIALLFFIPALYSTTMIELSLREMCQISNHIIIARTISVDSYWIPDQQRIFTDVTLEVSDKVMGRFQKQDRLKLTLYGGTVNGISTIVVGGPRFPVGEESVLFLLEKQSARSGQNYFVVVGLAQGKFNIFTDTRTHEEKVVRDQIETPLQLEKDGARLSLTDSKSINLVNFLNHIKAYVK